MYFLLGFRPLKMLNIKMFIRVLFRWSVQISFRSFLDSICSALFMRLFALQCRYYLRSGAGNIASDQTYFYITFALAKNE